MKKSDGAQVETRGEIEEELISYFKGIMIEDNNDRDWDISWITDLIPRRVTREDNEMLNNHISMQEFKEELNQMAQGKALGSDVFASNFFHFF